MDWMSWALLMMYTLYSSILRETAGDAFGGFIGDGNGEM